MKEKRYFCNFWEGEQDKETRNLTAVIFLILFIIISAVSGKINYQIMMDKSSKDLEAYSEEDYDYLDEIADKVVKKNGIDIEAIPKEITQYEIIKEDGKITFQYGLPPVEGEMQVEFQKDERMKTKMKNNRF